MITAVITNHNYGRYLRKCIESALEYCDEVIVCDDGSTDGSLSLIAEYPQVIVEINKQASGCPVWGSNRGIELATKDRIIFLDADGKTKYHVVDGELYVNDDWEEYRHEQSEPY